MVAKSLVEAVFVDHRDGRADQLFPADRCHPKLGHACSSWAAG